MANKNNNIELVNLTFVSGKDLMKKNANSFITWEEIVEKIAPKKKLFAYYRVEKKRWEFHKKNARGINFSAYGRYDDEILFSFKMKKHYKTLVDGWIPVYSFDRNEFEQKFNENV